MASLGALASVDWDDLESTVLGGARLARVSVLGGVKGAYPRLAMGDGCCKLSVNSHEGHCAQAPSYYQVKPQASLGAGKS